MVLPENHQLVDYDPLILVSHGFLRAKKNLDKLLNDFGLLLL